MSQLGCALFRNSTLTLWISIFFAFRRHNHPFCVLILSPRRSHTIPQWSSCMPQRCGDSMLHSSVIYPPPPHTQTAGWILALLYTQVGPKNPFKTKQQMAPKNMLSGYVEPAHFDNFQFENQRRTFHSFGMCSIPIHEPSQCMPVYAIRCRGWGLNLWQLSTFMWMKLSIIECMFLCMWENPPSQIKALYETCGSNRPEILKCHFYFISRLRFEPNGRYFRTNLWRVSVMLILAS